MKYKPLEECVETVIDHRGLTPKKLQGDWSQVGYRAISAKNIKNGILVNEGSMKRVDSALYKRWMTEEIERGYIFITSEAPFGEVLYWDSDEKLVLSQRVFGLKARSSICDARYLYYWMRCPYFQREMMGRSTGTTVTGLRQPELLKCVVAVPDLDVQKKIASTLSIIDKKIELNNRLNDYLTAIAMTLFNKECPQTNEPNAILSDIAEITMGQSPSGSSYNENGEGKVFYQGRAEFGPFFPHRRLYTTEPKRMAQEGDTLMSVRAPVGDLNVANEDCCIGRGLAAIHSEGRQSFVHYLVRAKWRQFDTFNGDGTVFGSINRKTLKEFPVFLTNDDVIDLLESRLKPIDAMIRQNDDETRALERLRNTLLPKLMSGEIDVSEVEI